MSETALATMPQPGQTAIQISTEWEKQLDLVKQTVAPGLTHPEFALFCHIARVRHLDPLQRQIHAVKRRQWDAETNGYVEKMTVQTGIDGFRAIANRTGTYMPSDKLPLVEGAGTENMRVTVWIKKYHQLSGQWMEFGATAYYREFVQLRKDKQTNKMVPNSMWEKFPVNMLTKCAEALALRRGWPEELGQIYTEEEMGQAPPPEVLSPNKQDKTQRDLGTLKPSPEPNRGHGNEGLQSQAAPKAEEAVICAECRVTNGHADKCPNNPAKKRAPRKTEPQTVDGRTAEQKAEDTWRAKDGHDPAAHITRKQATMLFTAMKDLGVDEAAYRQILSEVCSVDHTHLIPKDKFEEVLDAVDPDFKFHEPPRAF